MKTKGKRKRCKQFAVVVVLAIAAMPLYASFPAVPNADCGAFDCNAIILADAANVIGATDKLGFAATTTDDYANMASCFLQESLAARLPTKIDNQGVIRVIDPQTGAFGPYNPNGTTRTFFKPNSPTYFDRQPGTLVPR